MWVHRATVLAVLAGCGASTGADKPDAAGGDDADTTIDIDAATDGGTSSINCDFDEAADSTNFTTTAAETTNLTLGTRITMCGAINNGHYEPSPDLVDADAFKFTISADTDVVMHLFGTGIQNPDDTVLQIRQGTAFIGFGVVEGDHGTLSAHLPAGEYVAAVASFHNADLGAAIPYKLTIVPDQPQTRCAKLTTTADYPESADGTGNDNDVIDYNSSSNTPSTLSASSTDMPEPTNITVPADSSMHKRISGSSANVDPADDYEDRDTFAFTTGSTTTQLTIRLNWGATTVDLDYRVYPVSTTDPLSIVGGLREAASEYEFETFAVKPSTTYWLWVAAENGATGQPIGYDATLCGEAWAP